MPQSVVVRRYKSEKKYQKDAKKMAKKGYQVTNVTSEQPRAGCLRWIAIGIFAAFFKPKPELVVTYTYREQATSQHST